MAAIVLLVVLFRGSLFPPPPPQQQQPAANALAALDRMASPASPARAYDAVAGVQSDLMVRELDNLAADAAGAARVLLAYLPQPHTPARSTTQP